jgi:CubicO group peptidase (beta-lactamase class C family)
MEQDDLADRRVGVIHGTCADRYAGVRAAFEANFAEQGELGAACTVIVAGETVVDLWGGWADEARTRPWAEDTLVDAYSVGKAIVSLLLLRLVDAGDVALDEPVATYWPAFAAAGKERATVRHALCHRAGVPAIHEPLDNDVLWDFDALCAALARTAPWWIPGERHAYHTNTFGHLVGGIARQVTGRTPGELLAELAAPCGADVHFGVPEADLRRCADVVWVGPALPADRATLDGLAGDARMTTLGYVNPPGFSSMGVVNTTPWRRTEIPSTNGHMTARGIARIYAALITGELLSADLLAEAVRPQSSGPCPTLGQDVTFGLGFQPWTAARPFGRSSAGFGHFGTGGSLGFADPSVGLAFGYVMNHVIPRWQSPRNRALVDAVYEALGR